MPKTIYLIGASGALGGAVAARFATAGWELGLSARSPEGAEDLEARFPGAQVQSFDTGDPLGADRAFTGWSVRIGPPDACFHLAGGYLGGKGIAEWTETEWRAQWETNLLGPALCLSRAFSLMRDAGRPGLLIGVGAVPGVTPATGKAPYAVAKAGLLHLVRGLAEEGRPHGIRANAIVPGTIDTPANRAAMPNADRSSWSDPSEIARLLLVLAEGGTAATGSVLFV